MLERSIDWLLNDPPWIEYRTRLDLLSQTEDDPAVKKARAAMLEHPRMRALIEELGEWPGPILKSHKFAGHLLHKLVFIADDLGFRADDAGIANIIRRGLCGPRRNMNQVVRCIRQRVRR